MKFYYIDDTFFKETEVLRTLRERLFALCEKNSVSFLFVSSARPDLKQLENFLKLCRERKIYVYCNSAGFEVHGVRGILSSLSLQIEGSGSRLAFSGSVVSYDVESASWERIYLDFFPTYTDTYVSEDVTREIEEMLTDIILNHKKHQKFN